MSLIPLYEPLALVAAFCLVVGGLHGWSSYIAAAEWSNEFRYVDGKIQTFEGVTVAEYRDGQWHMIDNVKR